MTTFCSFQAPILKYCIFWSENLTEILKKSLRKFNLLVKKKSFKILFKKWSREESVKISAFGKQPETGIVDQTRNL